MKKIIALSTMLFVISISSAWIVNSNVYAAGRDNVEILIDEPVEEEITLDSDETTTSSTSTSTSTSTSSSTTSETTVFTVDKEKNILKEQIAELLLQLEEKGYTIDDLNITVAELQNELAQAYTAQQNNSNGGGGGGGGGSSGGSNGDTKTTSPPVTTTPTTTEPTTTTENTWAEPDLQGNANLVEDVVKNETERQFLTVSTKDGSIFYVIIDYESGNKNVYFLNKIDTADLNAIVDPDGSKAAAQTAVVTEATEPVVTVAEQPVQEKKKGNLMPIFLVLGLAAFVGGYYVLKIKPKKNAVSDSDYDYEDDDFNEEDEVINEDNEQQETSINLDKEQHDEQMEEQNE